MGYAIATFEFLEVTNATENSITFYYGAREITLPLYNKQATFSYERTNTLNENTRTDVTLYFYNDMIVLSRSVGWDDGDAHIFEWQLFRYDHFGGGSFADYDRDDLLKLNQHDQDQ